MDQRSLPNRNGVLVNEIDLLSDIQAAVSASLALLAGSVSVTPNGRRDAGVLHRDGITAVDKIPDPTADTLTMTDNGAGTGSLVASTTFYGTVIAGNRWGCTKVSPTIESLVSGAYGGATGSYRFAWAQITGADYYDLFLSADAAPKWVARVTEEQRAAGDYEVTGVGTVAAGGGNPAGTIDVNLVGTGLQTSNAVFAQNNAYRPDQVTPINCAGRSIARVKAKLAVTDLRSAPALAIAPFFGNQLSATDFHAGQVETMLLLMGSGYSLCQEFEINVHGETAFCLLIDSISGQGAAASIWVELV